MSGHLSKGSSDRGRFSRPRMRAKREPESETPKSTTMPAERQTPWGGVPSAGVESSEDDLVRSSAGRMADLGQAVDLAWGREATMDTAGRTVWVDPDQEVTEAQAGQVVMEGLDLEDQLAGQVLVAQAAVARAVALVAFSIATLGVGAIIYLVARKIRHSFR